MNKEMRGAELYAIKEKIVLAGGSKIFGDWHENAGISMDDFLKGIRWLCDDPMTGPYKTRMTRELGCTRFGGLRRLSRYYDGRYGTTTIYDEENGRVWDGGPSINMRDRI